MPKVYIFGKDRLKYRIMSKSIKKNFPVQGLGCAACVARVQNKLQESKGVLSANVSLASNMAQVEYNPSIVKASDLKKIVQDAGYDLIVPEESDEEDLSCSGEYSAEDLAEEERLKEYKSLKGDMRLSIILAASIMFIGAGVVDFPGKGYVLAILAAAAVFWTGRRFLRNAFVQAKHFNANMDTLVALSTVISWFFSLFNLIFKDVWLSRGLSAELYFDSGAMIVAFILVGRVLEEKAKHGTNEALRKLMGLRPGKILIKPGDLVLIKPGQRVPVDGTVVEGASFVDESLLTGEPVPVEKIKGSEVFAGTINQKGSFSLRAEKTGNDTMLSHIINIVKDAQGSKAKVQYAVDKVASVFVPLILLLSIATFAYWFYAPGGGLAKGLITMVSVLVIACPCSLGLATPTAIIAGIGRGARSGILIKDADSLQAAKDIDIVVLDKTGTLTLGKPLVTSQIWYDEKAKGLLKAMELKSEHPLAEAVLKTLEDVEALEIHDFKAVPGKGVEAISNGETLYVGNDAEGASDTAKEWLEQGKTLIFFKGEGRMLAEYAVSDELKDTSVAAIKELKKMKIEVCMLTGDNKRAAASLAEKAGIYEVKAEVLPDEKAQYIKELQASGKKVAMAGDGINDSAAMAYADFSVAMGSGSDIAMDAAMATIVSSDLTKVPEMIRLSKKTSRIIKENLFWAFAYNALALPAAAGILGFALSPSIAAACMALSSVCVVTNSLRLRK